MKRAIKHGRLDVHQATAVACVWEDSGRVIVETMLPTEAPEPLREFFRRMRWTTQGYGSLAKMRGTRFARPGMAAWTALSARTGSVWMSLHPGEAGVALIDGQTLEQLLFQHNGAVAVESTMRKETRPGLLRGVMRPSYLEA